jgi:hypothetical protein
MNRRLRATRSIVIGSLVLLGCVSRKYNSVSSPDAHIVPTVFWAEEPIINVCWENPSPELQSGWNTLKDALVEQYNGRTPVKFVGFGSCAPGLAGIHIFHEDGTPGETKARPAVIAGENAFGMGISGMPFCHQIHERFV